MRRFLFFSRWLAWPLAAATAVGVLTVAACSDEAVSSSPGTEADASPRKDGGLVGPADAGAYDAGTTEGPEPSCTRYCELVMKSCAGAQAQYESASGCLELCERLPAGDAGDTESNTVACRQYYAGSPAQTNAPGYCLAAGPFGGGVCGDRCTALCGLTIGACAPDAGAAPYGSYPDCQTSCASYAYRDGGVDGGGETPDGPRAGNTLNCRLYHVRRAVHDGSGCVDVGPDSGACR